MLSSQFENIVRKHHEVHQAIGRLNMPLKTEIILIRCQFSSAISNVNVNHLSMRFLWVAPLLSWIDSAPLLQVRVQHWEISQEICKLKQKVKSVQNYKISKFSDERHTLLTETMKVYPSWLTSGSRKMSASVRAYSWAKYSCAKYSCAKYFCAKYSCAKYFYAKYSCAKDFAKLEHSMALKNFEAWRIEK